MPIAGYVTEELKVQNMGHSYYQGDVKEDYRLKANGLKNLYSDQQLQNV